MGKLLEKVLTSRRPLLQVALDLTSIEDMVRVTRNLTTLPVDIYEVGTPLIKSEGLRSISVLRALVGSSPVVLADMKTADVGALEIELAKKAGADASTVLASSDDFVIKSALAAGSKLGVDVVVDTVGIRDLNGCISRLVGLGVKCINVHIGIDLQKTGITARNYADIVKGLSAEYRDIAFSISGGIKLSDIETVKNCGAKIVVVGSAITKSSDPYVAACKILKKLGEPISC